MRILDMTWHVLHSNVIISAAYSASGRVHDGWLALAWTACVLHLSGLLSLTFFHFFVFIMSKMYVNCCSFLDSTLSTCAVAMPARSQPGIARGWQALAVTAPRCAPLLTRAPVISAPPPTPHPAPLPYCFHCCSLKPGRVVVILAGRFAGKKAVVIRSHEAGHGDHKFGHVVGTCRAAGV